LELAELGGIFRRQRLGMVASSCATFMIGPFNPPSAAASAAASLPLSASSPNKRRPAMRAATEPTLAPTLP